MPHPLSLIPYPLSVCLSVCQSVCAFSLHCSSKIYPSLRLSKNMCQPYIIPSICKGEKDWIFILVIDQCAPEPGLPTKIDHLLMEIRLAMKFVPENNILTSCKLNKTEVKSVQLRKTFEFRLKFQFLALTTRDMVKCKGEGWGWGGGAQ